MSPSRKRHKSRGGSGWVWIFLLLLLLGGAAWWIYSGRPASWNQHLPSKRAVARPAPVSPASVASAECGGNLPKLAGGALAAARNATFVTLEQLRGMAPASAAGKVYRVEANLGGVQLSPDRQDQLVLQSLVQPGLTLDAWLPPGACAANQEDGALFDEIREDLRLRFSDTQAARGAKVVVTGVAAIGPQGLQLRPVLDWQVE